MSGNHPARAQKTHVVGGAPPTPNHKHGWTMMAPWYSGRMPENERTLPRALQGNGSQPGTPANGIWRSITWLSPNPRTKALTGPKAVVALEPA